MAARNQPKVVQKFVEDPTTLEKYLVSEYNKSNKTLTYFVRGDQADLFEKITFKNFTEVPSGIYLSKDGWGFTASSRGSSMVRTLREHIGAKKKIELIIIRSGKPKCQKSSSKVVATLTFKDLKDVILKFKLIHSKSVEEIRDVAKAFLKSELGLKIKGASKDYAVYTGGQIKEVLSRKGVQNAMNEDDVGAIVNFFPKVFRASIKGRKKVIADLRIRLVKEGKKVTDKIYLDEVIKEFEEKLANNPGNEHVWQVFLKDKVLPFLNNTQIIDRQKITLEGKAPDFVLVDVYGFADIIEIKTPSMNLLDENDRGNFHWSKPTSVAISQTENYLDDIKDNGSAYVQFIKKKFSIDLTLTRPRGFIIAGLSTQLKTKKMNEDYRRLRGSHKNVEFITFDELLANLKHIQNKLDR